MAHAEQVAGVMITEETGRGGQRPYCSPPCEDVGPSPTRTEKNLKTLRGG